MTPADLLALILAVPPAVFVLALVVTWWGRVTHQGEKMVTRAKKALRSEAASYGNEQHHAREAAYWEERQWAIRMAALNAIAEATEDEHGS